MSSGFCSQSMWAFSHLKQHNPQLFVDKESCAGSAGANSFPPPYWSKDQLLVPAWAEEITPIKWGTDEQSCSVEPTPPATDPSPHAGQQHLLLPHRAWQRSSPCRGCLSPLGAALGRTLHTNHGHPGLAVPVLPCAVELLESKNTWSKQTSEFRLKASIQLWKLYGLRFTSSSLY